MPITYTGTPPTPAGISAAQMAILREELSEDTIQTLIALRLVGEVGMSADGAVGDDTNPKFKWVVQNAGINRAELALYAMSDETGEFEKVWGTEITGTSASARDGLRGSHLEGFLEDGHVDPVFRLNSTPTMTLEFAAVCGQVAIGGMTRAGTTVTVNTVDSDGDPCPHGLGVGQQFRLHPGEDDFAADLYEVATVSDPDPAVATAFTYTDAGAEVSNTVRMFLSAPWDVGIKRGGFQQLHFVIGGSVKCILYSDSFTVQPDVQFVAAGGLGTWGQDKSATPGNVTINHPSGKFAFDAAADTVTVTCDKCLATDIVQVTLEEDDDTLTSIQYVTPGDGSFTVVGNATATAATKANFVIIRRIVIAP